MSKKKTHEEYVAELAIKNPTVEVIGEYIDAKTSILHKCKIHNIQWNAQPTNILQGRGCYKCGIEKTSNKHRKTHEQYLELLKSKRPDIIVLGTYIDMRIPILHKCSIDGFKWMAAPGNILQGCGCPMCWNNRRGDKYKKTHEQYVLQLKESNKNIEVIEEYAGMHTSIRHKCLIDGYEWNITPSNILNGNGCPKCAGNAKMSHDEYVEKAYAVNNNIKVTGKYINARVPILHKCLKDGYEWYASPYNILNGKGCPICNESKGERCIHQFLKKHNIKYECQKTFFDCRDIRLLPFDFYLPDYNCCVEYDGEQHFEPIDYFGGQEEFDKTVKHDKIKNEYCTKNNITLLRIPYFKNVEEELNNFLFI